MSSVGPFRHEYVSGAVVINDPDQDNPTFILVHVSNVGLVDGAFKVQGFAAIIEAGPGPDPMVFESIDVRVPPGVTAFYASRVDNPETPGPYWVRIRVTSLSMIPSFDLRRDDAQGFSRSFFRFQPGEFAVHRLSPTGQGPEIHEDNVGQVSES